VAAAAALVPAAAGAPAQAPPADPPPLARIAFTAGDAIHTIAADGSDRRKLTSKGRDTLDEDPAWSPDGRTIAFSRWSFRSERVQVWLVNSDGTGLRQLTPGVAPDTEQSAPTWSPDGSRIAFASNAYDEERERVTAALVSVASDGSDLRVHHSDSGGLRDELWHFERPAWSPSGDRLLFTRFAFGDTDGPAELFVVPSAGGAARRVARNGDEGAWAPSGDRIAYTSQYERDSGRACTETCYGSGEIVVANDDGSGRLRLTRSLADDGSPSWSGDGLRIAFHSDRNTAQADVDESPPELYSMRADGSCVTWLTNGTAWSEEPAFERDPGLSSDPGGCGAVPREPLVETGMPEELRHTFSSWWLGRIAPNGLLLTRVAGDSHSLTFGYLDCGHFDPDACGDFLFVENADLCETGGLRGAGRRGNKLSLARGALLEERRDPYGESGSSVLFTHRTRVAMDTASGFGVGRGVLAWLRRFPGEQADGAKLPSTRLPASVWRGLRASSRVSRREARRRRAVRRRLAQLGIERRLGCSG
jgi:Tol biopolymer transport system component